MFDALKNLGAAASMASVLKDLPKIKARMEEVRRHADGIRASATSGGGAVNVVATGRFRVEVIEIDAIALRAMADPGDAQSGALAAELVREATNAALERAQAAVLDAMEAAARDLNLPISGAQLRELL